MPEPVSAAEIARDIWRSMPDFDVVHTEDGVGMIIRALTAFGNQQYEEGYKKGLSEQFDETQEITVKPSGNNPNSTKNKLKQARREALEEAAKIAEFHSGPSAQLAEKIRALGKTP